MGATVSRQVDRRVRRAYVLRKAAARRIRMLDRGRSGYVHTAHPTRIRMMPPRHRPPNKEPPSMKYSYDELAGMIDHSLLHPTLTDAELEAGCALAAKYRVASVCVKPYAVRRSVELLEGTSVRVGCVVGFPHGNSATEVKRYETEVACRDGAVEIDMVINVGQALSGDWDYVEGDIAAVCAEAHRHGAKVKVILENDYL